MTIRKTGAASDQVIYDETELSQERLAAQASAQASAQAEPWTEDDEAGLAEEAVD